MATVALRRCAVIEAPLSSSKVRRLLVLMAILLALTATAYLGRGLHYAMGERGSFDLSTRAAEYHVYSIGVYPNQAVASNILPGEQLPNSVYPPYAFPLMAAFFAWESERVSQIVFWSLTFAALIVIGLFGYQQMAYLGRPAAALGAAAGLAIAHNASAVAFGQFSIICMGLVVAQLMCLQRGKAVAGGLFWAAAMIKPQIGVAFVVPFLVGRNWPGLLLGAAILVALSWGACVQTHVSPFAVLEFWLVREDYGFIVGGDSQGSSIGGLLAAFGLVPRLAITLSLTIAAAIGLGYLAHKHRHHLADPTILAIAAIVGRVFLPHRAYDNIMLLPALILLLSLALERKSRACFAMAAAFGLSVWLPLTSVVRSAWMDALLLLFWLAAAVFLWRMKVWSAARDTPYANAGAMLATPRR